MTAYDWVAAMATEVWPRSTPGALPGVPDEVARVVEQFQLAGVAGVCDFPGRGNIHRHTYLVVAGPRYAPREYLLQRINHEVFTRPRQVMAAMLAAIGAQRDYLAAHPLPPEQEWETITLVPTRDGAAFLDLTDARGPALWRLMEKIPHARTYKSLSELGSAAERLQVAEEAGRGLALWGDLTASMETTSLANPLPGYRDTRLYYAQLRSVLHGSRSVAAARPFLPRDAVVRAATLRHFLVHLPEGEYQRRLNDPEVQAWLRLAWEHERFAMTLLEALESGAVRTVAVHGDTKLDNFLFSARTGRVKALIDLDTIMPHTWLADWGDMVRSLVNVAGEKEPNPERVAVDLEVFQALARGFLSTARAVTAREVALMTDAVAIITLELGVRFLTDYLRGDTYFCLAPADPPDLNRTRARVQLTLLGKLLEQSAAMRRCLEALP